LFVTVFAVVLLGSGGVVDTVKFAAKAGAGATSAATLAARAIRLTPDNKRDMLFATPISVAGNFVLMTRR
jgi:hypothetical protein